MIRLDDFKDKNSEIQNSPRMLYSPTNIQVYFDGLCQPVNPGGIACYAFIVKNGENTIYPEYGFVARDSTNNVAEYAALIKALK